MPILPLLLSLATVFPLRPDGNVAPIIRVGLVRAFSGHKTLYVYAPDGGAIVEAAGASRRVEGTIALSLGGSARVQARVDASTSVMEGERILIRTESGGENLGLSVAPPADPAPASRSSLSARSGGKRFTRGRPQRITHYRGALEIAAGAAGELRIVNVVPLDEYVRGVVRLEIGADAPLEAQEAQAVAARTFALKSRGRYAKQGYDVTDTTACQAYGGVEAESEPTDRAVAETRGLALTRSGALILADYYDDCGGVTAPGDDDADFPPSVADRPEDGGVDYCAAGRSHVWSLTFSPSEANRIAQSLAGWPRDAAVADVKVESTDHSGRARVVRFVSETGATKTVQATALRATIGYGRLKSTLFSVRKGDGGAFIFDGRGYGHGRGMCQAGAIGMAKQGRGFRDILLHYFPGADVTRLDGDHTGIRSR